MQLLTRPYTLLKKLIGLPESDRIPVSRACVNMGINIVMAAALVVASVIHVMQKCVA